jgi:hypothetical protein
MVSKTGKLIDSFRRYRLWQHTSYYVWVLTLALDWIVYLSWNVIQDDILLELLGKWKEEKMLGRDTDGKKNLVVKHLFHQKSFFKALTILARDYYGLLFSTRRVMMRKFPTQYRLLILYSCTSIMVSELYPLSVGVTCGKFRVLQYRRVLEISETPGGVSVRLTHKQIPV